MTREPDLSLVVGRRRMGKTTLVHALARQHGGRVVVFDPLDQWRGQFGVAAFTTRRQLRDYMAEAWPHGPFQVAYVPPAAGEAEAFHQLCLFLLNVQQPYKAHRHRAPLLLVIEEANLALPVHQLPADRWGGPMLVNRGRHWGLAVIAASQKPSYISSAYRANTARIYSFALGFRRDREEIAGAMGEAIGQADLQKLRPYHFVSWSEERPDSVHRGQISRDGKITPSTAALCM